MGKWICLGFVVCASVAGSGFAASGGSAGSAAGADLCNSSQQEITGIPDESCPSS